MQSQIHRLPKRLVCLRVCQISSGLKPGAYQLDVSALGYQHKVIPVKIEPGHPLNLGTIELRTDQLGLDAVVVTGTMKESYVKAEMMMGMELEKAVIRGSKNKSISFSIYYSNNEKALAVFQFFDFSSILLTRWEDYRKHGA